MRNSRNLAVDT